MIIYLPTLKIVEQHETILDNIKNIQAKQAAFLRNKDRTIFSECHLPNGLPLTSQQRSEILSYLNNPSAEKWDCIYSQHITSTQKLWDAWNITQSTPIKKVKKNSPPVEKWASIPSPDDLVSGIKKIIKREKQKLANVSQTLDFERFNIEYKYETALKHSY